MGEYDDPAQVEMVLQKTGQKKLTYIGHSQGTSQMFYALSKHPDYWKEKMNLFVALAPVTSLHHTTSALFKYGAKAYKLIEAAANTFHIYSIMEPGVPSAATKLFCGAIPMFCDQM
jgi:lysosomal acid lipase/cholesteryl ester hydrolase